MRKIKNIDIVLLQMLVLSLLPGCHHDGLYACSWNGPVPVDVALPLEHPHLADAGI